MSPPKSVDQTVSERLVMRSNPNLISKLSWACIVGLWCCAGQLAASETVQDLRVFPEAINLEGPRDLQSIVVQAIEKDGITRDITAGVEFSVADPGLIRIEGGLIEPVANGTTTITIAADKRKIGVPVTVSMFDEPPSTSFKLDVMPVFTRAGCNTGKCHGSARGQDGFRLSLFGYDPSGDLFRITREQGGRRLNFSDPEASLLLTKATGAVRHTGGRRMMPSSPLYHRVLDWIEAGAPDDSSDLPTPTGIKVLPEKLTVLPGQRHRLTVLATYSDGSDRDVTRLARFLTNDEGKAAISNDGVVSAGTRGEAYVMARFATFVVGTRVAVVPNDPALANFTLPEGTHPLDTLVNAKLEQLKIEPNGPTDDASFARRAFLDLIGLLPDPEELQDFVADRDPNKREELVDALLTRDEFADLWCLKWADLLQIRSTEEVGPKGVQLYHRWLLDAIRENRPVDAMVRELLTSSGGSFQNPPTNYFQIETDTLQLSQNVAQVFLGARIQCAQCHNHPFDRWTMDDYYGFAALFAGVGYKPGLDAREIAIFDEPVAIVRHPVDNEPATPKLLGGPVLDDDGVDRRQILADWLTGPDNRPFARQISNLAWAHFFGKGIVDPVDDVRVSNPPSNPELLDELADRLVAYDFDFRKLVRDICTSDAYQRSTIAVPGNDFENHHYARGPSIRRIRAEVLLDIVSQVTETPSRFAGMPEGSRAVELVDGVVSNPFLTTFGRSVRETVCACEVDVEPDLSQALHMINGDTLLEKISAGNLVGRLLEEGFPPGSIVDELFLRSLSRLPSDQEKAAILGSISEVDPQTGLEDTFWALLNTKEFLFHH